MRARATRGFFALTMAASGGMAGCDTPPPSPEPGPLGMSSASDTESGGTMGDGGNDPVNLPPNAETSGTTLPMFTAGDSEQTSGTGDTDTDGPETDTESAEDTTGDVEPEVLPCDPGFSTSPLQPNTTSFFVEATHAEPLTHIDLAVYGPNVAEASFVTVAAENPWVWRFEVSGHIPGIYTLDFGNSATEGGPVTVHSTCQIEVSAP